MSPKFQVTYSKWIKIEKIGHSFRILIHFWYKSDDTSKIQKIQIFEKSEEKILNLTKGE